MKTYKKIKQILIRPIKLANAIFIIAISLLLILSYVSYSNLKALDEYDKKVDHTNAVILKCYELEENMSAAISNQRGYVLTNEKIFKNEYENHKIWTKIDIENLIILTTDNNEQKVYLDSLRTLIKAAFVLSDSGILLSETLKNIKLYDTEFEPLKLNLLEGKKILLHIDLILNNIINNEQILMKKRNISRYQNQENAPYYIFIISTLACILLTVSLIVILKDMRKREEGQLVLEQKIIDLDNSNLELEQFAYVASHDLQEPLRKIRSFIDRLLLKFKDSFGEETLITFDKIDNSAYRMQLLIDDLLNYSRVVNQDIKKEDLSLNEIMENVLFDLGEYINENDVKIYAESLPNIIGHPSQIHQLFLNLINNAIKFRSKDKQAEVYIKHEIVDESYFDSFVDFVPQANKYLKVILSDNGIGFNQKYIDKIFIIFKRLENKTEYKGTGIGLAICKRIIDNHNGYITAKSEEKRGSSFIFYLPI